MDVGFFVQFLVIKVQPINTTHSWPIILEPQSNVACHLVGTSRLNTLLHENHNEIRSPIIKAML
ncbi:MAG: hypothetical protein COB66_07210 [Coxiella sp. (in: Bacteria)]|nr:MAG: hypothetical protein COB66_07210 [Coxiella sp. (in: g-proteobacteria)]